jgi:hypothetical protein
MNKNDSSKILERGINSLFAFGGPKELKSNQEAQNLLIRIISDGNFLHSCLDYNNHLQIVRDIVQVEQLKTRIIVKCYLNYPEVSSSRRRSLVRQIIDVKELFYSVDVEIVPQISSIYYVPKSGYEEFVSYTYNELGIKRVLVEIFPSGTKNALDFVTRFRAGILNAGLDNSMKLGLTSYENKDICGFNPVIAEFISRNNLEISPMRILGSIKNKDDLESAFERLSFCTNYVNFFRGITQVSTKKQYDELNQHALVLLRKRQFQSASLQLERFKSDGRILAVNPYGLKYSHSIFFFIKFVKTYFRFFLVSIISLKFKELKKLISQGLI